MPEISLRRADDRFVTRSAGVVTRHAFSFGRHYDPAHVGHGPLVVCDEHRLEPDAGFAPHPHRDVEVVTWVLDGLLLHDGPDGRATVPVGTVQRMSAGRGVVHAETAGDAPTRFVQMWLIPDVLGRPPSYEQVVVPPEPAGTLVPVVSGLGHDGAAALGCRAALHAARLAGGESVLLPDAPRVHLHVTRGAVVLASGTALRAGDSARLTAAGALRVVATEPAELLLWEMDVTADPTR